VSDFIIYKCKKTKFIKTVIGDVVTRDTTLHCQWYNLNPNEQAQSK